MTQFKQALSGYSSLSELVKLFGIITDSLSGEYLNIYWLRIQNISLRILQFHLLAISVSNKSCAHHLLINNCPFSLFTNDDKIARTVSKRLLIMHLFLADKVTSSKSL